MITFHSGAWLSMLSFTTPAKLSLPFCFCWVPDPGATAGGESWSRWIGWGISRKKAEVGVDGHLVSLVDRVRTHANGMEIRGHP